jgi:ribosomal protein S18 acetylase RimI-like enzyme
LELSELRDILDTDGLLPYSEYDADQARVIQWHSEIIMNSLSDTGWCVTARQGEELIGVGVLQKLAWDSAIYGFEIAALRYLLVKGSQSAQLETAANVVRRAQEECRRRGIRTLFTRTRTEGLPKVHALESDGFQIMDTLITHAFDTANGRLNSSPKGDLVVRDYVKADEDDLLEIGRQAFQVERTVANHFQADPQLPKEGSDRLYHEWIRNALNGRDDFAVVAEVEGKTAGFVTCKAYGEIKAAIGLDIGTISVGGVSPWARGRGVYTALIWNAVQRLASRVRFVEVGTQISNHYVLRAWSKLGFRLVSTSHTLHWHAP